MSDGATMMFKAVAHDSGELSFNQYLSSTELREDPHNHSVPILDIVHLPEDLWWKIAGLCFSVLMVMPLLRSIDSPPFHCRLEVIDAIRQFLEVSDQSDSPLNDLLIGERLGSQIHASAQRCSSVF